MGGHDEIRGKRLRLLSGWIVERWHLVPDSFLKDLCLNVEFMNGPESAKVIACGTIPKSLLDPVEQQEHQKWLEGKANENRLEELAALYRIRAEEERERGDGHLELL